MFCLVMCTSVNLCGRSQLQTYVQTVQIEFTRQSDVYLDCFDITVCM